MAPAGRPRLPRSEHTSALPSWRSTGEVVVQPGLALPSEAEPVPGDGRRWRIHATGRRHVAPRCGHRHTTGSGGVADDRLLPRWRLRVGKDLRRPGRVARSSGEPLVRGRVPRRDGLRERRLRRVRARRLRRVRDRSRSIASLWAGEQDQGRMPRRTKTLAGMRAAASSARCTCG